ncbi:MAG: rhomboid family intramembrane serine protease, partial [Muribaculaceae bacterium]|nr:rhomboid family intramembrane serine protease [Muribaculaceae bacterium]
VLLGFAILFQNMHIYFFYIPVPINAKWMVLGYGVIELFFGVTGLQSGVAHFAHLGGMLVALLLILYWRKNGEINRGPLY